MELPDASTQFMMTQLRPVRSWFESLVQALEIGMTVGIIVAAIVTIACMFQLLFCFRKNVLRLRNGERPFKYKDGAVVYDSLFMGQTIATTIVGFIIVVLVCVLVIL